MIYDTTLISCNYKDLKLDGGKVGIIAIHFNKFTFLVLVYRE